MSLDSRVLKIVTIAEYKDLNIGSRLCVIFYLFELASWPLPHIESQARLRQVPSRRLNADQGTQCDFIACDCVLLFLLNTAASLVIIMTLKLLDRRRRWASVNIDNY
jgi:hypothetical protein